jgi:putative membrane protein
VRNRAKQAFLDHGVTETRDRSGVLIFLSELEHQVQILADRGIHERLGVETWQRHVRTITRAIREDRAGIGIVEVVQEIGEELAAAFPARDDDENELPDGVQYTPG